MKRRKRINPAVWIPIIIIILVISFFIRTKIFPPRIKDYTEISREIDEVVNQGLIEIGIEEEDLLKKYQEEKREGNIIWILYTKEVMLPKSVFFSTGKNMIERALSKVDAYIYDEKHDRLKNTLTLIIGKKSIPMQVLMLTYGKRPQKIKEDYLLAIIIDDVGYSKKQLKRYTDLGIPLTFAILPQQRFSRHLANQLHESGYETLLHLPLEPMGYPEMDPGKGCLFVKDTLSNIKSTINKNLKYTPFVVGVNNHMGSRFTTNSEKMRLVLTILKEKGLFFIDSYTNPDSCACDVGEELSMEILRNDMFLDNRDEYGYVKERFRKLKQLVLKKKRVIAIGHVQRDATPQVLKEYISIFKEAGIEFVPISKMLKKGYLYVGYGN